MIAYLRKRCVDAVVKQWSRPVLLFPTHEMASLVAWRPVVTEASWPFRMIDDIVKDVKRNVDSPLTRVATPADHLR